MSLPVSSTCSTLRPAIVSRCAIARGDDSGRDTWSRNQDRGTLTSGLPSDGEADPNVAFDQIADLGEAVPLHERALEAHAEREPAEGVGVDAGGAQDDRVHHAAATPLDPTLRGTCAAGSA